MYSLLANEYKCEIELGDPKIAFRETIKKKSDSITVALVESVFPVLAAVSFAIAPMSPA